MRVREDGRTRAGASGGVTHRRFAVAINLNAEGFEGGDLRFPEFGSAKLTCPFPKGLVDRYLKGLPVDPKSLL